MTRILTAPIKRLLDAIWPRFCTACENGCSNAGGENIKLGEVAILASRRSPQGLLVVVCR